MKSIPHCLVTKVQVTSAPENRSIARDARTHLVGFLQVKMACIASPKLPLRSQTTFRRCVFHSSRFPNVFGKQILSRGHVHHAWLLCVSLHLLIFHFICATMISYAASRALLHIFQAILWVLFPTVYRQVCWRKLPRQITQSGSGAPQSVFANI